MFWFGRRNKETSEERQERLNRAHAEMQQLRDNGKNKFNELCYQVESVLQKANKPLECNVVRFASEPFIFPDLKSYQCFFVDWQIWIDDNILYIYCPEVENYPEDYYDGDAPAIAQISISDIQYFRVEGSTYTESKISGGNITQNRHTGIVKQAPLKSKTVEHDTRKIKMNIVVNGVVKMLEFEYSAYDILCALLPDKEHK